MADKVIVLCNLGPSANAQLARDPQTVLAESLDDVERQDLDDVVAIVVRSGIAVDEDLLRLFPRLRFVIRAGSGVDNIVLRALSERGIELLRRPSIAAQAVGELALASLILLARRVPEGSEHLRRHHWAKHDLIGESVADLRIAIWGAGPVGQACYQMFQHCQEVAFASWAGLPPGSRSLPGDQLCAEMDVHIICLPLRESTRHLFGPNFLQRSAKRRPYIVNVARFECLDFESAVRALKARRLRGLFVDPVERGHVDLVVGVLSGDSAMNLLVSPHLGAQRKDVMDDMSRWVMTTLSRLLGRQDYGAS